MNSLHLRAPAKVNLTLEVLGRRPDGYHEVRTVLQAIDLADELTLTPAADLRLEERPGPAAPPGENLVLRAARLLREHTGGRDGAQITLDKRVPVAAGLGGGSSDAAAALLGLDRLWGLGLDVRELTRLASRLGSDVPFFLRGGTALGMGSGDVIEPLPSLLACWVVLLVPPVQLAGKTARLYGALTPGDYSDGSCTLKLVEYLYAGMLPSGDLLSNSFDRVAPRLLPELARYWGVLLDAGAPWVHLAGSGPGLFTLVPREEEARSLERRLAGGGLRTYCCRTLGPQSAPSA
ncbi:MAG: 4-(cytidine 5'-diphospho)-2-C-methyl-D-erythritol kinase [Chloroflexi bacterium]|nr:4-(cytidine 5'-diphospho)-2-C-methyl-D-erythritol kinase [Chloroflexota bacterium]